MSGTVTSPNNLNQQRSPSTAVTPPNSSLLADFIQETLALTKRLFIQLQRRPSTLVAGIIQPLMWLVLFGALFKNAPAGLFGESQNYGQFLGAGVIVFTAFAGALNAGLPIMFDREFGFLNRLLVAPSVEIFHSPSFGDFHRYPQLYPNRRNRYSGSLFGFRIARNCRTRRDRPDCPTISFGSHRFKSRFSLRPPRPRRINRSDFCHQLAAVICQHRPRAAVVYATLAASCRHTQSAQLCDRTHPLPVPAQRLVAS
jgi:hypothetical protein